MLTCPITLPIPAEAIPFLGVAVLIADTSYELYAACETMRGLDELYLELGVQEDASGDTVHTVCNPELPDADETGMESVQALRRFYQLPAVYLAVPKIFHETSLSLLHLS